jgi:hypothetical protein
MSHCGVPLAHKERTAPAKAQGGKARLTESSANVFSSFFPSGLVMTVMPSFHTCLATRDCAHPGFCAKSEAWVSIREHNARNATLERASGNA